MGGSFCFQYPFLTAPIFEQVSTLSGTAAHERNRQAQRAAYKNLCNGGPRLGLPPQIYMTCSDKVQTPPQPSPKGQGVNSVFRGINSVGNG